MRLEEKWEILKTSDGIAPSNTIKAYDPVYNVTIAYIGEIWFVLDKNSSKENKMATIKEIRATTGYYTDKDGKKKNTYKTVGAIKEGQYGDFMEIDVFFNFAALPRKDGSDKALLALVEPYDKRKQQQQSQQGNNVSRSQNSTRDDNQRWQTDLAFASPNPADDNPSDIPF